MPVETVKVQRPVMPHDGDWLVYDKARKHISAVAPAAIPAHVKTAMGKDHKAYFNGAWSSIVGWGLSDRVKEQSW